VGSSGATAAHILNGSTLGTGLVSIVNGTLQFLMMTVLGLPLAFPVGVLTFFGGFIPYVGGFIASGLAFLIAIAAGNPTTVVVMLILTVGINILIGNFVAPFVLGKTVSVHPAVILLAAPAGAAIGGLVGMFLIVPVIAIVLATWRSVLRLFDPDDEQRPVAVSPPPEAPVRPAPARPTPSPAPG
jgi:putative heme transporter